MYHSRRDLEVTAALPTPDFGGQPWAALLAVTKWCQAPHLCFASFPYQVRVLVRLDVAAPVYSIRHYFQCLRSVLDLGEARWKAQNFRRTSVLHVPIFCRNSSLRPEWFVAISPFLAHHLQWAVHEGVQHFLMHPSQGWDIGAVCGTRHHLLVRKYARCMVAASVLAIVAYVMGIPCYVLSALWYARRHDKLANPEWLQVLGFAYTRYGMQLRRLSHHRLLRSL